MENLIDNAQKLLEHSKEYVETYAKYKLLQATEKVAGTVAGIVYAVLALFFLLFILMFLGIATGIWLGNLTNSMVIGFLCVAAIFLLIIILLFMLRKKMVIPFLNNLIISILNVNE
jgi:lipopolysaccharide export LptBFGC system permease protein LptF